MLAPYHCYYIIITTVINIRHVLPLETEMNIRRGLSHLLYNTRLIRHISWKNKAGPTAMRRLVEGVPNRWPRRRTCDATEPVHCLLSRECPHAWVARTD